MMHGQKTDNCRAPLIIFWIITPIRIIISFQHFGGKVEFCLLSKSQLPMARYTIYHCIPSHTSDWPQSLQPSHIIHISFSQPLQHSLKIKSPWSWRQHILPKHQNIFIPRGVTTQKTATWTTPAMKNWTFLILGSFIVCLRSVLVARITQYQAVGLSAKNEVERIRKEAAVL
jgi:hypothetical protein